MKVLVTGASGFIGRHVVRSLLETGLCEVVALSRESTLRFDGGARSVAVDLFDPSGMRALLRKERPTHLIHLAWEARPGIFWTAPTNADWLAHSLFLAKEFREAGGERAVFAGSCAEYAWTGDGLLSEGGTSLAPKTLYGVAKDALQRTIAALAPAIGLSVAWGRIFWLYGPGEAPNRLVSDVLAALKQGSPVDTSMGLQSRDYMHVRDVADAFVAALRSEHEGPFNIGSGNAVQVRDIVGQLGEIFGRPDLLRFGQRASPLNDPPMLVADVRLLTDVIGFCPKISLEKGLRALARGE